jgi:hypothetical protein
MGVHSTTGMVVVWLLGAIDILSAAVLGALAFGHPFQTVQAIAALLLCIKGIVFASSVVSRIDIVCAIGMIALLWMPSPTVAATIGLYLGVKGVFSFI